MEQIKYHHKLYSKMGIDSFPPIFKADNIKAVLDFRTQAITEIDQAAIVAMENAQGVAKALFGLQRHPLYRLYTWLNNNPNRVNDYHLCFFAIQDAYHRPAQDPADKTKISLAEIGGRFMLEAKQPSVSDIVLLSPFAEGGSYFSWDAVREVNWSGRAALMATYAEKNEQIQAKYTLVYIKESDEINRRTRRRRPIELVSKKRAVTEGIEI